MILDIPDRAKPIIKWAGGKSGLLAQLGKLFPPDCKRYFEPFLGGGAVFLALREGLEANINDSNEEIVNLYLTIRDQPRELMASLDELNAKYSEEFYYETRKHSPEGTIERAARTIFLNKCGFNGLYRQNSKGQFNVPFGKRKSCPALYNKNNLLKASNRLSKANIHNEDFETIIERAQAGDFVYCDPPYHPLSASSSFNAYQAGGFSELEQIRLKEACERAAKRGAMVAISNSTAPFILNIYEEHTCERVIAKRAINSNGSSRGEINELLVIMNFVEALV